MAIHTSSKIWLITGATSGIGLELARVARSAGHTVLATYRDAKRSAAVITELEQSGVNMLQLDIGVDNAQTKIEDAVTRFGRVDVLVNNAGYALAGTVEDASTNQIQDLFSVNLLGPVRAIQAVLPSMRANQSGTIVNVGSANGIRALPGLTYYSASKHAIEALTEGLQAEISSFNIRVLLIEPGLVATRFGHPAGGASVLAPLSTAYEGTVADQTLQNVQAAYTAEMGASPEKTAQRIVEAVDGTGIFEDKEVALRLPLGVDVAAVIQEKGKTLMDIYEEYKDISASV